MQKKKPTVAIIGGGISGLTVSQLLQSEFDITLFEKARGLGGRLATTYNNDNCQYDIGAQFFTSKTAAFSDFLKPYIQNQNIQCWCGSFLEIKKSTITKQSEWTADYPHWVAAPKMTSLCKSMANGADIRLNHKVTQIKRENNKIKIELANNEATSLFDYVVITIPPEQATSIIPQNSCLHQKLNAYPMDRCMSVSFAFDKPIGLTFAAALVKERDISLIANNVTKPSRENFMPSITLLSTNRYANKNTIKNNQCHIDHLKREAELTLNTKLPPIIDEYIHYWKYANKKGSHKPNYLYDDDLKIGYCSDGLSRGMVENAFLNAKTLVDEIFK